MADRLTHIDEDGRARMVDVSQKDITLRYARARARVEMHPDTAAAIRRADLPKGDCIGVARLAGIMAAKQTASLIPLCHPLGLDEVEVEITIQDAAVEIVASTRTQARTGVEMEALTAASIAALTIYDMAKSRDRGMRISGVELLEKRGGRSGDWVRDASE